MNNHTRGFTSRRHPELDSGSSRSNNQSGEIPNQVWNDIYFGFTLIEVLVVVLIIGILAAVAVPQYQKAVLKSRYSALMPIGKAIAEGNEVYYMEHGAYATSPTGLDVTGKDNYEDGTDVTLGADPEYLSYVRVANSDKVPDARYVVYQKHSANFADTTMCEAKGDTAKELCQRLGGVFVSENGTEARWASYLLSGQLGVGSAFKEPCPENAVCNENDEVTGCNNGYYLYEGSCRVAHASDYDYAGTSSCRANFRVQQCNKETFGDHATCDGWGGGGGRNAYCQGSTFSGESQCMNGASCGSSPTFGTTTFTDNASCTGHGTECVDVVFSGESSCTEHAECMNSTFSGKSSCDGGFCSYNTTSFTDEASCVGASQCFGAVFSGNSTCTSTYDRQGCSYNGTYNGQSMVSTFTENAVCAGTGCNTANYEGNACCAGTSCPTGVKKCVYNATTGTYDRDGVW